MKSAEKEHFFRAVAALRRTLCNDAAAPAVVVIVIAPSQYRHPVALAD